MPRVRNFKISHTGHSVFYLALDIFARLCKIGAMFKLVAEKRDGGAALDVIRKAGKVPAVFYSGKVSATSIFVPTAAFKKVWKEAGESSVVTLELDGKNVDVLIHDVAFDPVRDEPIHIDFYAIDKDTKVTVSVPLEFIGESAAVKNLGGTLLKVMHEIEVEGLPKDLPHDVKVDIGALETLESHIVVSDLKLPAGVVAKSDVGETVALITIQKEEVEEAPEAVDLSAIEVEKKGKKDLPAQAGEEGTSA